MRGATTHAQDMDNERHIRAGSTLNFRGLGKRIWSQRYWIAVLYACLMAVAAALVLTLPARYVSTAEILILPQRSESPLSETSLTNSSGGSEGVRTELLLLQSSSILKEVGRVLGPSLSAELNLGAFADDTLRLKKTADAIGERLSILRIAESRLIRISCWSFRPEFSSEIVNTYLRTYLATRAEMQASWAREMERAMERPVRELQEQVRASEQALEKVRQEQGIIDIRDTPLVVREMIILTEQLAAARSSRIEAESRAELTGSGDTNRRDIAIQRSREERLEQDLERLKADYERQNQALIKVREIERESAANRALLTSVLERYKQIQLQSIIEQPNLKVISWAETPVIPASPRRALLLGIGMILSFVLALSVGLTLYAFRNDAPH